MKTRVYEPKERLLRMIQIKHDTNCWEWKGAKKRKEGDYGSLIIGSRTDKTRKTISAHRYSYIVFNGDVPDGLWVLHKCDNPSCINPEHLFLGTRQDNIDDRENKNRNNHAVGERCPRAKLKEYQVLEIRSMLSNGKSIRGLARKYGVHHHTIMDIRDNKTWCHLLPERPEGIKGD